MSLISAVSIEKIIQLLLKWTREAAEGGVQLVISVDTLNKAASEIIGGELNPPDMNEVVQAIYIKFPNNSN